jgi:hypothetical protein
MKIKIFILVLITAITASCGGKVEKNIQQLDIALYDSLATMEISNIGGYESIDLMYSDSVELPALYRTSAFELKQRTDEMVNFIQDLKRMLIIEAEGPDSYALSGNNITIFKVKRLNNTSIPGNIMIGKDNDRKAYDLQSILDSYKSFLTDMVRDEPDVIGKINSVIDLSNKKSLKPGEEDISWVDYNFRKKTMAEVLILLSRLQIDVRSLESEVIALIMENLNELTEQNTGNN